MTNFIGGNQIKLLRSGAEYFPALEVAIENAVDEVYLQTYIFEVDKAGVRIGNALREIKADAMGPIKSAGFGATGIFTAALSKGRSLVASRTKR